MAEVKKKIDLTVLMLISMALAVIAGLVVGEPMTQLQFIGDIFFALIQMSIPVFVLATVVKSVGGLTPQTLSGIAGKGVIIFIVSSGIAAALGIALGVIFQPGASAGTDAVMAAAGYDGEAVEMMTIQDTLTGFFGTNIVASLANGSMIQIIIFAVALGLVISFWRQTHDECKLYDIISETSDLLLNIIRGVMTIAPIGIFCYVSSMVASVGMTVLVPLAKYFLVMAFGMVIMFVAYCIICGAYCRVNPVKLAGKLVRTLVTAFTTISSAVTLPTAMEDAKKSVAIHMTVDALCIAQLYGIAFGPSDFLTCWLICTMISFVNAATPGASLVSLTMMIPALGLPMEAIGIFGGLEYPTGATRTPLNVTGDVFAAMLVAGPDGIDHDIFDGKKEYQEAA